jgi:hypothetical protein
MDRERSSGGIVEVCELSDELLSATRTEQVHCGVESDPRLYGVQVIRLMMRRSLIHLVHKIK